MKKALLFGVAILAISGGTLAADLVPGVEVIRGTFAPGSQPDGNTVLIDAPEGLIVIDTGRHGAHTQAILDAAIASNRQIRAVINTHWHLDHISGNAAMRVAYPEVKIYATNALKDALRGFLANYRKQLQEMIPTAQDPKQKSAWEAEVKRIDSGPKLLPDVVIQRPGRRTIAGHDLYIGTTKNAVTAADLWVFDETSGVIAAGDLVTLPAPFLDTACPANWAASLDEIAKHDFAMVVPGHGSPMTRRQFLTYRDAFKALLACKGAKEACINDWVRTAGPLMPGHDEKFTRSLMNYYVDVLRGEDAAKRCGK